MAGEKGKFVNFRFYKVDPSLRRLDSASRETAKEEFLSVVQGFSDRVDTYSYATLGIRGDADFLLWRVADELDHFYEMSSRLLATELGPYLHTPYSYLSMTRESIYLKDHRHEGQEGARLHIKPLGRSYLFVYPFVKKKEWYAMTKTARQGAMNEHFQIGHRYPEVRLNTTYSYGLDDQEFVLAFESDHPDKFVRLIMELRESEATKYTERDTPQFTCLKRPLKEILDALG